MHMQAAFISIAISHTLLVTACGGGAAQEAPLPPTTQLTITSTNTQTPQPTQAVSAGDYAHSASANTQDAGQVGAPAVTFARVKGISTIPVSAFVRFVGFSHGDKHDAVEALMPAQQARLGKRSATSISGSEGLRYAHHLEISWSTENGEIDYISIKSPAAARFLREAGRQDTRLDKLWGMTEAEARTALGAPSFSADRPHAKTYRYDFTGTHESERGTLSLEFSKLASPARVNVVSVHWLH